MTTADLQHFFVMQARASPPTAPRALGRVRGPGDLRAETRRGMRLAAAAGAAADAVWAEGLLERRGLWPVRCATALACVPLHHGTISNSHCARCRSISTRLTSRSATLHSAPAECSVESDPAARRGPGSEWGRRRPWVGVGSAAAQQRGERAAAAAAARRNKAEPAALAPPRPGPPSPQVRFDHAADEQLEHMWASFYPAATAHGPAFRAALRAALAGRDVTAGT